MKVHDEQRYEHSQIYPHAEESDYGKLRGWILDAQGEEVEVEPAEVGHKNICVVCEVMGVFTLGMPPASRQEKKGTVLSTE